MASPVNILITLDYELYFGERTGTQQKCIIHPTERLIEIANKHNIRFCFFVDVGYLVKLNEFKEKFPQLESDYLEITLQVKQLSQQGHEIGLHIHPHWEDSFYDGTKWNIIISRYKFSDFNDHEITDIAHRYTAELNRHNKSPVQTFRAGGWCVQPFDRIKEALKKNGIITDTSVFRSGYHVSEHYDYDFRNAPDKTSWKFEDDPLKENPSGYFTEIPIASMINSPLHFWKLFLLGRLYPSYHKPVGDGRPMLEKGYRKNLLTRFTNQTVSFDGYNASLLQRTLNKFQKSNIGNEFVIIGHPKALSNFSFDRLDNFIKKNKSQHNFTTYNQFLKNNS